MSLKALSNYTIYSRYAHYIPEKRRRETWDEITDRVFDMHARRYAKQLEESAEFRADFEFAKEMVRQKRVLGSQRALQFGGKWIERANAKLFNCSFTYLDRARVFAEIHYLLLCGCGVGFSVQKHHVGKLPDIKPVDAATHVVHQVADSIEGWGDATDALLSSYFSGGPIVRFDYSLIRPAGTLIAGQFKAPGHKGLENALEKIRALVERRLASSSFASDQFAGKLRPIDAYDIVMHIGDSVLSGGIRRSATISLFSHDDAEMMAAKTGNWYTENPQRGRSNNSVLLVRSETTWEQFAEVMKSTREFGEPGFYFASSTEHGANPCQPAWASVLTPQGISTIGALKEGDVIWSETGWTTVAHKWSTGIKPVNRYRTTAGVFYGTENHRLISGGQKVEAKDADSIDRLVGPDLSAMELDPQDVIDGIVLGDGSVHGASGDLVYVHIGQDDVDYHHSEVGGLLRSKREGISSTAWEVVTTITAEELPLTFNREVPSRFLHGAPRRVAGFLRGLYTANGSIVGDRITLKSASFKLVEQVQLMLSSLGIASYYTTNRPKVVEFKNGPYLCKESFDLNITADRATFAALIGFVQTYKVAKVDALLKRLKMSDHTKTTYDIVSVEHISDEEVFDITVDNEPHTYWTGGLNVSNCVEIGLYPQTPDGRSGVQFCNLCEINGKPCDTEARFLEACRAASILGTMQAGYTDFRYLSPESSEITAREALLGVSITGVMDNPEVLLSPKTQRAGAQMCKDTNRRVAHLLGLNPAARITCTKPAGSTSCVLQTASGIHPHHARRYLRRVQANQLEFPLQHYKALNPDAVERSVWSANGTDDVISFACEVPKGAVLKNDLDAIALLSKVKSSQVNWVLGGENPELCVSPGIHHNISNTVTVRADEWDKVARYIYENREYFTGISLLSASGDLDYPQAPFATVLTPEEIVREYGDGSILASGLVVDGLHAFEGNLWAACDQALGMGAPLADLSEPVEPSKPVSKDYKTDKAFAVALADYAIQLNLYYQATFEYRQVAAKRDWVRRLEQFADRYFPVLRITQGSGLGRDLRRATYCLKHVSLWHTWLTLKRTYKDVDWSEVIEDSQAYVAADTLAAQACAGGACEIR